MVVLRSQVSFGVRSHLPLFSPMTLAHRPAALVLTVTSLACAASDAPRAGPPGTAASASTPGPQVTASGTLQRGAAGLCDRSMSMRAEARRGEAGYRLNLRPVDSAGLARALAALRLAERPRGQRVVQVDVDSSRTGALVPLLAAIEQGGGLAFLPDTTCAPLPAPLAPRT